MIAVPRVLLISALMVAMATSAAAQQTAPKPPPVPPGAPVARAIPDPFSATHPAGRDLYQSPDGSDRFLIGSQFPVVSPPIVVPPIYIPGPYGPYYAYHPYWRPGDYVSYYPAPPQPILHGGLVLESVPDNAEVFVDGYYEGLAEEFGARGRPLILATGSHRIELRAPGYDTTTFSVRIDEGEILRYRGTMPRVTPERPPAVAAPSTGAARPLYVIPKCYAGDRPPSVTLPPGCDRKNLQTQKK